MDKALRNAIIAGIIIIALSLGYYLVIFIPKKEAMRLGQQRQEADQQKQEQEANALKEQQKTDKEKQTRADCYNEAGEDAQASLKKKIDAGLTTSGKTIDEMKRAYERGGFLKDDFDSKYEDCLSRNGLKK